FSPSLPHLSLHSFPTRRSSDLAVSPARKDATLSVRSQGDFFGMGCLSGLKGQSLRVSTATALDLSQLIRIRKAAMTRALREHLRSEEHTSELQSRVDLVCRLLL